MGAYIVTKATERSRGPDLHDVSEWMGACLNDLGYLVRLVWTRGAAPRQLRLTVQAYTVVDGRARVAAEHYEVWPSRHAKTPEALMLNALIRLEDKARLVREQERATA